jgi:MOSC domain-containing protein YiiM
MSRDSGRLEAIWIKRAHGGPMDAVERAALRVDSGLVGNADQGGKRQVTLIEREVFAQVSEELGAMVDPMARRANLLVSGLPLEETRDRLLSIGGTRIRIRGETKPCEQMDAAVHGLRMALSPHWRGGVYGEVVDDGEISVGNDVEWVD